MSLRLTRSSIITGLLATLFIGCGDEEPTETDYMQDLIPSANFGTNADAPVPEERTMFAVPPQDTANAVALPSIAQLATNAGTFSTLLAAVNAAGLTDLLADANAGPFTVFAPNDTAFAAVDSAAVQALLMDVPGLTRVLQHHIVAGKFDAAAVLGAPQHTTLVETTLAVNANANPPTIGGAGIIATDLNASNGFVHVIDAVLFPPSEAVEEDEDTSGLILNVAGRGAAVQPASDDSSTLPSIANIAIEAGTFSTLLAAVEAAELTGLLLDPNAGPFTVFAPNDDAFAAIDSAALDALIADVPALTNVLMHHIVSGKFDAEAVLGAAEHISLADTTLAVDTNQSPVTIDGAGIIATDLEASNGYVHVIDSVIFPPAE